MQYVTNMPRRYASALIVLSCLLTLACGDDEPAAMGPAKVVPINNSSNNNNGSTSPGGPIGPRTTATPDATDLSLTIQPFRPRYTTGDTVTVQLLTMRSADTATTVANAVYRAEPQEHAETDGQGKFTFTRPGAIDLIGCEGNRCVTKSLVVASPLEFQITAPSRGAFIVAAQPNAVLEVQGRISAFTGTATVAINDGAPFTVTADTEGAFSTTIVPNFGYNRIKISVKDDATPTPAIDYFDILWAPAVLPVTDGTIVIQDALRAVLHQSQIDQGSPLPAIDGPVVMPTDFAQMVEVLAAYLDVSSLLASQTSVSLDRGAFRATGLAINSADVDLRVTDQGMDLALSPARVTVKTEGRYTVDAGRELSLEGSVQANVSAYSQLGISLSDGLKIDIGAPQVSIDPNVTFDFVEPDVNAALEVLRVPLTSVAESLGNAFASEFVAQDLPELLESAFDALANQLTTIPIIIDPMIEGLPRTELTLGFRPASLTHATNNSSTLTLNGTIDRSTPVVVGQDAPGIPLNPTAAPSQRPGSGISVTAELTLFNALCFEMWRAGALKGSPELAEIAALFRGAINIDAKLPPIVSTVESFGPPTLEFRLSELQLTLDREGFDGPDTYAIHIRVGVTPKAENGYVWLQIDENEVIDVQLIKSESGDPLDAEFLKTLTGLIWPQIKDPITDTLRYGIEPAVLDQTVLNTFTRGIEAIEFGPNLDGAIQIQPGRVGFDGRLMMKATITP